jgi:hypothetical protein
VNTFANEPLLELRREAVRREALAALAALDLKLPLEVPMLIGADVVEGRRFASVEPCAPTRIVAHAHGATAAHVEEAITRAERGHAVWSRRSAAERAATLARAAGILRTRRLELTALAVRECGKPWAEADADVCEAIDFLEYYAQQLTRDLVQSHDIVLTMGPHHLERAEALGGEGRTHLLTAFAGGPSAGRAINDPFGGDLDQYRETLAELQGEIRRVFDRLAAKPNPHTG